MDAARWLAAERPDWRFEPIHGVGHVPQLETPELVVDIMTDWVSTSVTLDERAG